MLQARGAGRETHTHGARLIVWLGALCGGGLDGHGWILQTALARYSVLGNWMWAGRRMAWFSRSRHHRARSRVLLNETEKRPTRRPYEILRGHTSGSLLSPAPDCQDARSDHATP